MNFQVFTSCEILATAWIWTNEWFFSSMNSDVIYKLVFGFESGAISRATVPVASVIGIFLIFGLRFSKYILDDLGYQ